MMDPFRTAISFARKSSRQPRHARNYVDNVLSSMWLSVCFAIPMVGLALSTTPAGSGLSPNRLGLFGFITLAAWTVPHLVLLIGRWHRFAKLTRGLPAAPAEEARICIVGTPAMLDACGEVVDAAFEPEKFNVSLFTTLTSRRFAFMFFMAIPAAATFMWLLLRGPFVKPYGPMLCFPLTPFIGSLIALTAAWLQPAIATVFPGRIVMTLPSLRGKPPLIVKQIDLALATITVDFRREIVLVELDQRRFDVSVRHMPRRREFVNMLLRGAITRYRPPVDADPAFA